MQSFRGSAPLRVLVPALLVVVAEIGGAAGAGQVKRGADAPRTAAEAVGAAIDAGGGLDPAMLQTGLAALGSAAASGLFDVLRAGAASLPDGAQAELSRAQELRLLLAFRALDREQVLAFLASLPARSADVASRALGLRVLGEIARERDLELALLLARGPTPAVAVERPVQGELETTLGRLFRREPSAVSALPRLLGPCAPELRAPLVRSVARSTAAGRTAAFALSLGRVPAFDPILLVELRRAASEHGTRLDDGPLSLLRAYLSERNAGLVLLAIQAAEALGDHEALPTLVSLVGAKDENVAAAAHHALVQMTGLTWSADPKTWARWSAEELRWWQVDAPGCAGAIAREDAGRAGDAIVELSRHRMYPDRAAQMLLDGLARERRIALLACKALANVRSDLALPSLVELLDGRDEGLRHEAWLALRARTGLELAPDSERWARRLNLARSR
jgi:hypothetical protein